jgi:guanine deaminase
MKTLLRGRILTFHADLAETEDNHRYIEDGAIIVENGVIVGIGNYSELADSALPVIDHRPHLIMPGLIDPHIHFPQVQVIASWGKQLLDCLNGYVFPGETRFADPGYAARMAEIFLDLLLAHGTTTACAFASVHPGSVDALFAASEGRGMRMIAGKVMMDRNAPDGLRDTPQRGYDETKALIERWSGKGRLQYAITPRFAITSTAEQMKAAGTLASEHPDLHIQTHLSENQAEVEYTLSLYPSVRDYLDVYEAHGLLGPRSLMGHAIRPREIARMAEAGTRAVFCPTSNLFLGSGLFDAEGLRKAGVVSGVATDVGGGTHYSLLQTLNEAYKVLQLRGQALYPLSAFHWATRGNALALGLAERIGSLSVGTEADLIVLDSRATPAMALRAERIESTSEELFLLQILGDDRAIAQTYLAGMPMKRAQEPAAASRSQTRDLAPRKLLSIDEI